MMGGCVDYCNFMMPPTRGHDLKLRSRLCIQEYMEMPPTRGHDLKLINSNYGIYCAL